MTTSYELSLKLKELGVEQSGEYYWLKFTNTSEPVCAHYSSDYAKDYDVVCRAFTLGELVRELGDRIILHKLHDVYVALYANTPDEYDFEIHNTTPEEAAGELLAELKQKEG